MADRTGRLRRFLSPYAGLITPALTLLIAAIAVRSVVAIRTGHFLPSPAGGPQVVEMAAADGIH